MLIDSSRQLKCIEIIGHKDCNETMVSHFVLFPFRFCLSILMHTVALYLLLWDNTIHQICPFPFLGMSPSLLLSLKLHFDSITNLVRSLSHPSQFDLFVSFFLSWNVILILICSQHIISLQLPPCFGCRVIF